MVVLLKEVARVGFNYIQKYEFVSSNLNRIKLLYWLIKISVR